MRRKEKAARPGGAKTALRFEIKQKDCTFSDKKMQDESPALARSTRLLLERLRDRLVKLPYTPKASSVVDAIDFILEACQ
jgi:hypothetical protein